MVGIMEGYGGIEGNIGHFGTSVGFGKRVTGKLKWPLFS